MVQVTAVDQYKPAFSSTAQVTINIKDANDNSPTFKQDTYRLNVSEHSPIGTELAIITVSSLQSEFSLRHPELLFFCFRNSHTLFCFLSFRQMIQTQWIKATWHTNFFPTACTSSLVACCSNSVFVLHATPLQQSMLCFRLPYFDVESRTGKVYVKSQELLDRELRSLYTATLQAKDTDGKPGSTVLEITLTDINDKPPVMNRDSYVAFVREGQELEVKIEVSLAGWTLRTIAVKLILINLFFSFWGGKQQQVVVVGLSNNSVV